MAKGVGSDLHLDYKKRDCARYRKQLKEEGIDTLILCGDTASLDLLVERLNRIYVPGLRVYLVFGNHEPYGGSFADLQKIVLPSWCIYLPTAGTVEIAPDTAVIGCDGWGGCKTGLPVNRKTLGDARTIKDFALLTEQEVAIEARKRAIASTKVMPAVRAALRKYEKVYLVTHQPPVVANQDPDWGWNDPLGDEIEKIETNRLTVLCGHTHPPETQVRILGNTKVVILEAGMIERL